VCPCILEHHCIARASAGVASASMPAVNAIEVAARINLRISAGTSKANANCAFEFGIVASCFRYATVHVQNVPRYRPYFTSVLLEKLLCNYLLHKKDKSDVVLSSREQSVVQLIAEGHTNKSVGAVLNLSVKTVETHRASAMRKLGISSTAELVRYAIRTKLIGL
jgi:DNA-binding NarL/FixJ family response regulator